MNKFTKDDYDRVLNDPNVDEFTKYTILSCIAMIDNLTEMIEILDMTSSSFKKNK